MEAGQKVYVDAGCGGCHGGDLAGGVGPSLLNIGNEPVTDLPTPISQLDKLQADYADDPRTFLERWIRDSAVNYNDGTPTGMPAHPEGKLSDSALQALITFLLSRSSEPTVSTAYLVPPRRGDVVSRVAPRSTTS